MPEMTDSELHELKRIRDANKTELVQLLWDMWGIRAHRGLPRKLLATALVTGNAKQKDFHNPFDTKRKKIIKFLTKFGEELNSQLILKCTRNCFDHNDMQVLGCWRNSQEVLQNEGE